MWKTLPAAAALIAASLPVAAQTEPSEGSAVLVQAGAAERRGTGKLVLFVFDGNDPVSGATLLSDGSVVGQTGADGGVVAELPGGQHNIVLKRDGQDVLDLDLLTASDEQVRVIATLEQGKKPDLNIQGSGSGAVLAQDSGGLAGSPIDGDAGSIQGVVTASDGSPVADARVLVPSRGLSVTTDSNGSYQLELPPGAYQVSVSHPNFGSTSAQDLQVSAGKAVTANLLLSSAGVQLADYTVTAEYQEGSIASEISLQRNSDQITSVIGAEQIARTGDSNAAEALQRVSGVLIEDNRFAVIRGQPYRYTLTTLNGLQLPSPDPIIEAVPLNLFPDSILASIQVQKSYSVDQPGNFGGGLIGINTVSAPVEPFVTLRVSTGGNTLSTGEQGLSYQGGDEDFLGQDDGERKLPGAVPSQKVLDSLSLSESQAVGRSFDDFYLVENTPLPADVGFEGAAGRSFQTDYGTYGAILTSAYSQKYRRAIERDITYSTAALVPRVNFLENRTDRQVQISSLLALSAGWDKHEIKSNTLFLRDSQDRTQIAEGFDLTSDGREERRFLLEFQRRDLLLTQLIGEHDFDFIQFDWRAQTADTKRDRPDRTEYTFQRGFGTNGPLTFFSDRGLLRDFNKVDGGLDSGAFDLTLPLPDSTWLSSELRGGYDITRQDRTSTTRRFQFEPQNRGGIQKPLIEQVVNDNKITDDGSNILFSELTLSSDRYTADTETQGFYVGTHVGLGKWLESDFGIRNTTADYSVVTGGGVRGGFDRDFRLPSVSLTGLITPDMKLRGAIGKTVSYPRIVELSATTFFDPDTGEQFLGNPELQPTEITSYDLRWEYYPSSTEMLNLGVFYKELKNSIEQQFLPVAGGGSRTTFINAESGTIRGIEAGGRLSFDRLTRANLIPFAWVANTYIQANVSVSDSEVQLGETVGGTATNLQRPLTGQADTTLNLQLGYDGNRQDFTLLYNRVGERLDQAGIQERPDVYQQPLELLGFTYSIDLPTRLPYIGKLPVVSGAQVKFKGNNLLDARREFRQGDKLQRQIEVGRSFTASFRLDLF